MEVVKYEQHVIYRTTSVQLEEIQLTKLASCLANPILTIFGDKSVIFLDQRSLLIDKFQHDQITEERKSKKSESIRAVFCQDFMFQKKGKLLICLFDHNQIQAFKFLQSGKSSNYDNSNEDFDLSSIVCKVLVHELHIPSSGVLCPLKPNTKVSGRDKYDYLTIFSHFGGGHLPMINMKSISLEAIDESKVETIIKV